MSSSANRVRLDLTSRQLVIRCEFGMRRRHGNVMKASLVVMETSFFHPLLTALLKKRVYIFMLIDSFSLCLVIE